MGLEWSVREMCTFVALEAFRQGGTEPLDRTKHQTPYLTIVRMKLKGHWA